MTMPGIMPSVEPDRAPALECLGRENAQLRACVCWSWTLVLVVLVTLNLVIMRLGVPLFRKVFDDFMPGGLGKLPVLTQWTNGWSLSMYGPVLTFGAAVLGILPLWRAKFGGKALLISAITAVGLLVQLLLISLSLCLPLIPRIVSLNPP